MRKFVLALVLSVAGSSILASYPAFSQDGEVTEKGVARTASLYFAIAEYCPVFFRVNEDLARKLREASYGIGMKKYGEERFYGAAGKEFDRRKQEVEITGARYWCDYQYSHQLKVSGSKEANPFIE